MSILVIAEHDHQQLLGSTLNTLGAAQLIGSEITLLVAGHNCGAVADAASQISSVRKVLLADQPAFAHGSAENLTPLLVDLAAHYTHILAPATTFGKNLLPRAAALLDVQQISDISAVISADTFERPIYAGNAMATVQSSDSIKLITVRTTKFDAVTSIGGAAALESIDGGSETGLSELIGVDKVESSRPELSAARVVVAGGRGLQSAENFQLLETLADRFNAALGASRAAVDAGFIPNDCQIGQTGKVVAPDLYFAIGISGAIQHVAGMKDSKLIVAINKDEEAPIFQVADYGLVADALQALPELIAALDQ